MLHILGLRVKSKTKKEIQKQHKRKIMNYKTEAKSSNFKSIRQLLLVRLVWVIIITLGLISTGCDNNKEEADPDEYYVKYEVNSSTIYSGGKLDVTINSETNVPLALTIYQRVLWEAIVGPVEKGFVASMSVKAVGETNNQLKLFTNIYVSKNNSPFALKKTDGSDSPRDQVNITYTIDY
jgi:hypothetical protein